MARTINDFMAMPASDLLVAGLTADVDETEALSHALEERTGMSQTDLLNAICRGEEFVMSESDGSLHVFGTGAAVA